MDCTTAEHGYVAHSLSKVGHGRSPLRHGRPPLRIPNGFPKSWGYPSSYSIGIFHHPAIGAPPFMETPKGSTAPFGKLWDFRDSSSRRSCRGSGRQPETHDWAEGPGCRGAGMRVFGGKSWVKISSLMPILRGYTAIYIYKSYIYIFK